MFNYFSLPISTLCHYYLKHIFNKYMLKSAKQPSLYVSPRMNHCWITRRNDDVNDEVTMLNSLSTLAILHSTTTQFSIVVKIKTKTKKKKKKCLSFSIFQHAELFHDLGLGPSLQKEIALSKRTRSCFSVMSNLSKERILST